MSPVSPRAAVVGAGPAGLMAAEVLSRGGARVTVFDRMPTPGRKFLMAGRGGLNITHSEGMDRFLPRYGAGEALVAPALAGFDPDALRRWCAELGEDTTVGSSGRVFPRSFKASPLLRAWLRRLGTAGVAFRPRHRWTGWVGDGALRFAAPDGEHVERFDAAVLAMGGASWPQLGSDGRWTEALRAEGAAVSPLAPSNCGFAVAWSDAFRDRFEGQPLKHVALSFGPHQSRGEAVVTRAGLEGGGVYALSGPLRDAVAAEGSAVLAVDLQPDRPREAVVARLAAARAGKASVSTALRKALHLSPVAVGLLQEAAHAEGRPLGARDDAELAALVGAVPVRLDAPMPIAGAISSAGGLAAAELDARHMLRRRPGTFAAGEMLDWEAPTGGYLLQACFATGAAAGAGALAWLAER
ncbi:NAD(P)/FAD-dependent oxidoreductase [Lichenibacterium dinghuense]|uniref:NAD(P)/FAD-dependent oxidoreductase n=1 Tax=Lichenibacterium dinghuense TaxID=2895977 RepID=UPI0028153EBC|nr:TIGR03862 family flavoprotein [Lichenibacterium sp. 6Y81]